MNTAVGRSGPLTGIRVLEFTGIGPGPHCGMLLADLGADVLRVERKGGNGWPNPVADRGRRLVEADIRSDAGRAFCLEAADGADALIEGFRPGTMERLGLGPDVLLARNPRLVYGRVTGWGQTGPLSHAAGHDINYIALTGALAAMGEPGKPAPPPLNLVGDFGGGSMLLAFGILAALVERQSSGKGQVVDAAIVDGAASLMGFFSGLAPRGLISLERERCLLGGAAPQYRCYMCKDGREIAVGALEPQFQAELLDRLGAPQKIREDMADPERWQNVSDFLAKVFAGKTREEWRGVLEGTDACFAPVLALEEAPDHPQMRARNAYKRKDGVIHPAPAPRFSRTPGAVRDSTALPPGANPWE
ncbi:MAG: CoA transferase [Desulfovibrio sp.]|jgi:alpha-methylacyl-CoA racemase|nr:CoA transferase [Desulfovibrio sp.]